MDEMIKKRMAEMYATNTDFLNKLNEALQKFDLDDIYDADTPNHRLGSEYYIGSLRRAFVERSNANFSLIFDIEGEGLNKDGFDLQSTKIIIDDIDAAMLYYRDMLHYHDECIAQSRHDESIKFHQESNLIATIAVMVTIFGIVIAALITVATN